MPSTPKTEFAVRDKVLLQGDADLLVADTKRFFSKQRLELSAARDERSKISREIHDGVLQVLTAVSLKLASLSRLISSDPKSALMLTLELDDLVSTEQHALRTWLAQDGETAPVAMTSASDLSKALEALCRRAESQWGLRVELMHGPQRAVPRLIADHVYRIVQEAMANAGKHARAAHVRVRLRIKSDDVLVVVTDDGLGFPFRGQYDLALLHMRGIGPRSLMQRVDSLHGGLLLTSTSSGSTLEITLPLFAKQTSPSSG
jgi:signal transduction histidine kinase